MADMHLLQRLQYEFQGHSQPFDRISSMRAKIAENLDDLVEQQRIAAESGSSFEAPLHIEGVRRQYLHSLQRHQEIKTCFARLQHPQPEATELPSAVDVLNPHIELLRLRREYRKISIIAQNAGQANRLSDNIQVHTTTSSFEQESESSTSSYNVDHLESRITDLRRSLEFALLTANHQLQHEKLSLSNITPSNQEKRPAPGSKYRALETTRYELTNWIESLLAKCDYEHDQGHMTGLETPERGDEITDKAVEDAYQQYCEARLRVVQAASALGFVLPDLDTDEETSIIEQHSAYEPSILAAVEMQYLTLWEEKATVKQQDAFFKELAFNKMQRLTDDLRLLSDESHLLPSYPLLKQNHHRSRSTSQINALNIVEDPKISLLRAWKFANEAATINTSEAISRLSNEVEDAGKITAETLDDMKTSWTMWERLNKR